MDAKIVESIYSSTVAIAWHAPGEIRPTDSWCPGGALPGAVGGPPITVVGTGFLIAPRVVLTALHVIRAIEAKGVQKPRICVCVCTPVSPPEFQGGIEIRLENVFSEAAMHRLPAGEKIETAGKLTPSIDLCMIVLAHPFNADPSVPEHGLALPTPQGLKFARPESVKLLDPVIVSGYLRGQQMVQFPLAAGPRFGPMLMSGHVATIAPFCLTGFDGVTDYFIDVTCGPGLSGGPVCNESGEVVGMLTAGLTINLERDVQIPQGVARVLPLSERSISEWRSRGEKFDFSTAGK